ncbi:MAG: hypothetical protein JO353_06135 [Phycisphaerae bacterium]|nr:hypothetical protein [Phycisphaerae bacterium]
MNDFKAARALGWTSLAIAATEILGQGFASKNLLGLDEHPYLMRALGVRELIAGATILSQKRITTTLAAGLWSRVAGDAMDLALMAVAAPSSRKPASFASNGAVVTLITALDVFCAFRISRRLMMAKLDVRHRAALDGITSPAAQPSATGVSVSPV